MFENNIIDNISVYIIISASIFSLIIYVICRKYHTNNINREFDINNRVDNIYGELEYRRMDREKTKKIKSEIKKLIDKKNINPNITLNEARLEIINEDNDYKEKLLENKDIKDLYDA